MASVASRKVKKMKLVRQSESPASATSRTKRESVWNNNARPVSLRRKRFRKSSTKRGVGGCEARGVEEVDGDVTDKSKDVVKELRPTEEFDSECSLDVMIDSNDAPDSDSNQMNNYYSSQDEESGSQSQDDGGSHHKVLNDSKQSDSGAGDGINSTPRTRSRGSVKINLWTLDDSPILAIKRPKTGDSSKGKKNASAEYRDSRSDTQTNDESSTVEDESTSTFNNHHTVSTADQSTLATELTSTYLTNDTALVVDPEVSETIKELKILVTDVKQLKHAKVLDGFAAPQRTPSPKARKIKKSLSTKSTNNRTLDSWFSKTPKAAATMANNENSDSTAIDKSITPLHAGRTTRASVKVDGVGTHENGET